MTVALERRSTALELGDLSYEQWKQLGRHLGRYHSGVQWWIGDWLLFGERRYGEMYVDAIEATGLDYSTLTNYKSVAKRVPPGCRREGLSWSHHRAVAQLPPAEQRLILAEAENRGWSKQQIEDKARGGRSSNGDKPVCESCGRPL